MAANPLVEPTADEQYLLQLVNSERAKTGAQPLAFSTALGVAADGHNTSMFATNEFAHVVSNEPDLTARVQAAGYNLSGAWSDGENIAWKSISGAAGISDDTLTLHQNLMNSEGHRANILNAGFSEAGISVQEGQFQGWDGVLVTEDFGHSGSNVYVTGAAFSDANGNAFYDPGEGLAGVTVTATDAAGHVASTTTMDAGGYQLALAAGEYDVTFSGAGAPAGSHHVTIAAQNVALDIAAPASASAGQDPAADTGASTPAPSEPVQPADSTSVPPAPPSSAQPTESTGTSSPSASEPAQAAENGSATSETPPPVALPEGGAQPPLNPAGTAPTNPTDAPTATAPEPTSEASRGNAQPDISTGWMGNDSFHFQGSGGGRHHHWHASGHDGKDADTARTSAFDSSGASEDVGHSGHHTGHHDFLQFAHHSDWHC
ncbi:CAP domain-containing protein [Methylobacterium durans]|uniref:SCP domain-containing protein n=1 Tax=Methylobacterium durans TaxID=2202825 RepID=A0A2U8W4C6_9HYPH|nr:CAP domain-containing protein [Methylobacterium durans]AWN40136.1 hypothetical protein DK389_05765 [Methylobacterium durans]